MNITIIGIHFLGLPIFQIIDTLKEGKHGIFQFLFLPHELKRKKVWVGRNER